MYACLLVFTKVIILFTYLCNLLTGGTLKTAVAPKNINMEDKENYDPRTASLTTKKLPSEKVVVPDDSDSSNDGFDVSEGEFQLDDDPVSDDDSQGTVNSEK